MLKRLFVIGAALAVAFSLSLSSFAADTLSLGFPLYGYTRVRQGGSQVYLSAEGSIPISSDSSLSLNGSGGSIVFDFFPMVNTVNLTEYNVASLFFPYVMVEASGTSNQYLYFSQPTEHGYDRVTNPMYGFDSDVYFEESEIDLSQYTSLSCKQVESGQYVLEGTLVFASGAIGSLDNWYGMISGLTSTIIDGDGNSYPIGMTSPVFEFFTRGNNDFINFRLCLDIPYSGVYQRLFFQLTSKSSGGVPSLKGFFVNTGSIKFQSATNTQSLSILLGTWFDKLIGTIKANSVSDDDKAAQAEESADREAVSEAQSQVSQIEAFESGLNSSITESVSDIDFTVPSSFGAALGAVGFVFGGLFSDLGGYQIVITIPLILGIMLVLIGRGTMALGKYLDNTAEARDDKKFMRNLKKNGWL